MAKLKTYHILIASLTAALSANAATIDCSNIDTGGNYEIAKETYDSFVGDGVIEERTTYAALAVHDAQHTCPTYECTDLSCGIACQPDDAQAYPDNCYCDASSINKTMLASALCGKYTPDIDNTTCTNLMTGEDTCDQDSIGGSDGDDIITSCARNEYYGSGGCTPCPTFAYNGKQYDYVVAPAYDGTNIQTEEDCYVPESSYYVEGIDERGTYRQNLLELDGKDGIACTLGEQ